MYTHICIDTSGNSHKTDMAHGSDLERIKGRHWIYVEGLCTVYCEWCKEVRRIQSYSYRYRDLNINTSKHLLMKTSNIEKTNDHHAS